MLCLESSICVGSNPSSLIPQPLLCRVWRLSAGRLPKQPGSAKQPSRQTWPRPSRRWPPLSSCGMRRPNRRRQRLTEPPSSSVKPARAVKLPSRRPQMHRSTCRHVQTTLQVKFVMLHHFAPVVLATRCWLCTHMTALMTHIAANTICSIIY